MTDKPVSALQDMLTGMKPVLHREPYRFLAEMVTQEFAGESQNVFAIIQEEEGRTFIVQCQSTNEGALFARITLQVHSDLEGVGLTAAISNALADIGIACNVIAGLHHDHLFVPWHRREEALTALENLSQDARR